MTARPEASTLAARLEHLEAEHATLCQDGDDRSPLGKTVAVLAARLRASIERDTREASVQAVNRLLFNELGVRSTRNLKDPCNLLPSRVLERKQGYCVGIAALYLALAQEIGLPVYAVATPSHLFLRYDDGVTRINIETFQQGAHVPDEQYIREHRIPERAVRKGVFLRNLTAEEFLAQVHNNLGVVYSERRRFEEAARQYEEAVRLDPRLPAAWYNHGNDLLLQGDHRRAARTFSRALRLHPTDAWALNNRGLAYLKMGKHGKARRDFEKALRIDPAFEQARRNLLVLPSSSVAVD